MTLNCSYFYNCLGNGNKYTPRTKTLDGSEIGRHLQLADQGCQPNKHYCDNMSVRSSSSRSSEIINRNSFNNSKEEFVQKRLSFEMAGDPAAVKSTCTAEMKGERAFNPKPEENKGSNLTEDAMAEASCHSRYCCDNIPVV